MKRIFWNKKKTSYITWKYSQPMNFDCYYNNLPNGTDYQCPLELVQMINQ